MSLLQLNLNDLLALEALLMERHITRAARRCGLSQSAMSHALRRLRTTLNDPLLVRGQSGLVLTPRAARLGEVVARALAELQQAMFAEPPFDPQSSERVFHVACVDLVVVPLLVPLMRIIEREAPRVGVIVHQLEPKLLVQQLENDVVDVAILGPELTPGMRRSLLYTDDDLVCLLHRDHPALGRPWTLETFQDLRYVVITPNDDTMIALDRILAQRGIELRAVLHVPYFVAGTMTAALSDLAVLIARRMAMIFTELMPVVVRELPFEMPVLPVSQVWHPKNDSDAGLEWFRNTIVRVLEETYKQTPPRLRSSSSQRSTDARRSTRANKS